MLRISREQEESLQAWLDEPVVDAYCEALGRDSAALGIAPDELRSRVAAGLGRAHLLGASDGFERNTVVALSVFLDPGFGDMAGIRDVLADRTMSLEARLRFLTTRLLAGGEPGKAS